MNNKIFFFQNKLIIYLFFIFQNYFIRFMLLKSLNNEQKLLNKSERIQDSLIKAFMVRNKIFRSDFMQVTKSCIDMQENTLILSFYIH